MAVEVLDQSQPWPITLPEEPPRDRYVLVRNADGSPARNGFRHNGRAWIGDGTFGYGLTWPRLVAWAMEEGLTLLSIPSETGDEQ